LRINIAWTGCGVIWVLFILFSSFSIACFSCERTFGLYLNSGTSVLLLIGILFVLIGLFYSNVKEFVRNCRNKEKQVK